MAERKLTPKRQLFVQEYLVDLNATQAAIRAGYSTKTAYSIGDELLKNPEIKRAIEEANKKRLEKAEITAAWVLREAGDLFRMAKEVNDFTNANRSLELIGKHTSIGAFKERIEHSGGLVIVAGEENLPE